MPTLWLMLQRVKFYAISVLECSKVKVSMIRAQNFPWFNTMKQTRFKMSKKESQPKRRLKLSSKSLNKSQQRKPPKKLLS